MPPSLPPAVQAAAKWYAIDSGNSDHAQHLIEAFGMAEVGDEMHRRAVWLCVLAVRKVLYGWQAMECEGDGPRETIDAVAKWVQQKIEPRDWLPLCVPAQAVRGGKVINDCDSCRANPIASAAANTAKFARMGAAIDGAQSLFDVWCAVDEGIHRPKALPFEQWIAKIALPAAFELRELSEGELKM